MTVNILVVDDEPDTAELFRQSFRRETRAGTYVIHFASSGPEALEQLSHGTEPTIVILSDISMPGIDEMELLRQIKTQHPDLPVMMMTAYGYDERRRRAMACGAAEFFTKPVDFDQLKERLRQLPAAAGLKPEQLD